MSRPIRWLRPVVAASAAAPLLLLAVVGAGHAAEAPTGAAAAQDATAVVVRSFAYQPDPVRVTTGSQVRWRWEGDGRHSVTAADRSFDSDPDCEDNVLLRENCRTGGSEDFVWTAPDVAERTEIAYACKLHGESEGMTGTVVVVPAPAPSPDPEPSSSPAPAPSPSTSRSEGDGGSGGGSGGGSEADDDDPAPERQTGTAPRLGTRTAPGGSPPPVASPEVAAPLDDPDLEPFPSPAPIPSDPPSDLGSVALDLPDDDGGMLRTVLITVAAVAVTGAAVAFGSLVLFGPRWR